MFCSIVTQKLLIENSNSVAKVDSEIVRRLETFISLRSSEDELENDGAGKRKKRRSGSLNRKLSNCLIDHFS